MSSPELIEVVTCINTDPNAHWYFLGPLEVRLWGNYKFHALAAFFYTAAAMTPVVTYIIGDYLSSLTCLKWLPDFFRCDPFKWAKQHPGQFVFWGLGLALSFPLFVWIEAIEFESWYHLQETPPIGEKDWFYKNAEYVENFWKAVGGFFLGAGLLANAEKRNEVQSIQIPNQ